MREVREFELATILSMTTGYSLVDNFSKVFELVGFICDDSMINGFGLCMVRDEVVNHLFIIYPELKSVEYQKGMDINVFLTEQEEKFGKFLPITKLGVKLPLEDELDGKRLVKKM